MSSPKDQKTTDQATGTAKQSAAAGRQDSRRRDPREQALKYKAFKHTFSEDAIRRGLSDKALDKKLRRSNSLVERYRHYLELRQQAGLVNLAYPWRNPFNWLMFATFFWLPRVLRWGVLTLLALLAINYIPGPTQHIVEILAARAVYDTAPIARLPASLESYAHSARIVDRQGNTIKSYGRRQVTLEVPEPARKAILACEDHYFLPHDAYPWYVNAFLIHPGVSWFNMAGAVRDTLRGTPRGASTVVMQNAKKILGNTQRTVANKLEEIILAYMMVARFGKEQNLDFYINTVPVGANIYGLPAAAESYFRKDLEELNYQQLVAIGAFIPNHFRQVAFYRIVNGRNFDELDPNLAGHARAAINKVNLALAHLHRLGEISEREYRQWRLHDEESIRNIGFRDFRSPLYGEEEWTSWNVIREVTSRSYRINGREVSGSQLLLDQPGDVVIETAIDLNLTENAKKIIDDFLNSPEYRNVLRRSNRNLWRRELARYDHLPRQAPFEDFAGFMEQLERHLNVGVIAVNQHGEIVSYVGGKEFGGAEGAANLIAAETDNTDGTDGQAASPPRPVIIDLMNRRATVTPSSTIKPVVGYYAMVAADVKPEHTFADEPVEFKYMEEEGRQIWLPRNWYDYDQRGSGNNRYRGRQYSLTEAQVLSVNTIFARLYTNRLVQNAMLSAFDRLGLEYNREDARYWPFGIGATDLPVQQWLAVYNAFLDGFYREPTFVSRITVNDRVIYQRAEDPALRPLPLFDARREREASLKILHEVVSRGTGVAMRDNFPYFRNLVSGKTGTAPQGRSSLFVSHFNPQRDRGRYQDETLTMMVLFTTNTGGFKSVGMSSEGPVKVAGEIYNHLFQQRLQEMMDRKIDQARQDNAHFRNNHVYWANVNRYLDTLLNDRCPDSRHHIHEYVVGVDGFAEAVEQILSPNNQIYTGRDEIFNALVRYYCDQERIIRID
ncbi:transglycosylase domain-containing protein [Desulfurivibrio alkaliphilus]|uniref:Glycosyl transferase family 51 n=1 Tax=Desulfurivibrio alkaliphilus (strain DSM 19089 / UNIQEM U267 / AHT2) TaxID=589865 RepID=D6Z2H6_DESAT|nr:transglycosylase domain-containing protein [Desulfurivibrio alkaliphilus]ADH85751.1 glycosyl transferase family 51 [Desulfurivibrio alkaliphilus AHT 2]